MCGAFIAYSVATTEHVSTFNSFDTWMSGVAIAKSHITRVSLNMVMNAKN